MKLTPNQKTAVVIAGVVIAMLLLVKIIGWNKINPFSVDDQTEEISILKERIKQDSIKVSVLQLQIQQGKDSVEKYQGLYVQAKDGYRIITRWYEQRIDQVRGLPAKEAVAYFNEQTDCEDIWDTVIVTRLANISCANIKFAEREMFLSQRDTLIEMNDILEENIAYANNVITDQDNVISIQNGQIKNYNEVVATQEQIVADLQKEKKKVDKKLKRAKFLTIITGSAAIVLGAILILQ
jgi:uncharacterized protein with von Willebrand factor type A (vWA) domain